jgi:hypothetical protein
MSSQAIRISIATLLAGLLSVLGAPVSGATTPPTAAAGQSYPAGTTLKGVCEINPAHESWGYTTSQFESRENAYGKAVGWTNGDHGIWMGPGPPCTDTLQYPGLWRLHILGPTGDSYGPTFKIVAATTPCTGTENQITSVSTSSGSTSALLGLQGSLLSPGQTITADQDVQLTFGDGALLRLAQGSTLKVGGCTWPQAANPRPFLEQLALILGKIWASIPGKTEHVEIHTVRVTAAVRGTIFWISYVRGVTALHVDKGSVLMSPVKGRWKSVIVTAGHTATQSGTKAPVIRRAPISLQPPP